MKREWKNIAVGLFISVALTACGGGGGSDGGGGTTPTAEEWLLFANDESASSNNLTVFKASASSPIQTPIPAVGNISFSALPLGEIHFANGKAFVVISEGLKGPLPAELASGGLAIIDLDTPNTLETTLILSGTVTGRPTRIVHAYIDPEGKFLWANNDGTGPEADSVFRINIDPADTNAGDAGGKYLDFLEIEVGNGHKKSAFSHPTAQVNAKKLFITSSLNERRIDVIDDDSASGSYGQVIKRIRNVGGIPHGMDYSPAGGRAFTGITGGGVVSIDATQLDAGNDGIDFPDVDCGPGTPSVSVVDDNCVATGTATKDPSVYKLTTGVDNNPNLLAGYVHVHTGLDGTDRVYTGGHTDNPALTGSLNQPQGFLTVIDPGSGNTPPSAVKAIELGNQDAGSFNFTRNKVYVPSSDAGTVHDKIKAINVDPASTAFHTVVADITVGVADGEHRNGKTSPDGRLAVYPNISTNTASVIDTETDQVIDTVILTSGTRANNIGIVHLPFDAEDSR
jgi:hypothetical protein